MALVIQSESRRHADAYTFYLQLGGNRSYAKVATKFDVSETSIRKWAKSFQWKHRILNVDEKINAIQDERAQSSYISTIADFKNLKEQVFRKMFERLNYGDCSISELSKILKAIKVELGEPTEIQKGSMQLEKDNPFSELWEKFTATQ